jgi:RHH-type proline utilization regulon transcriptional repressor/proline dehydrogenase/delta 1-pyrroline-5-carboxylate dehydrogenase
MKAGGPNYVAQFMDFTDVALPNVEFPNYEETYRAEFAQMHDHFKLIGQDNYRRYRPWQYVRVRVHPDDTAFDMFARVSAAHTVGCHVSVSIPANFTSPVLDRLEMTTEPWAGSIEFVEETDEQLADAIRNHQADRIRYAAADRVPVEILKAAATAGVNVVSAPVSAEGRLELLWYVHEQSVSIDYHRYGNLGRRVTEPRAEPE